MQNVKVQNPVVIRTHGLTSYILKFFQDPGASETIEEELGLTGATADDVETEYVRKICEHEIVTGMM